MHKLRKLRIVHWIGLLVVLSMVMVACVPAPAPGAASSGQAPAASNAAESTGSKDLKILYWQAPTILNPHQATGTKDFDAAHVILEPLAHYNEKDQLVPYLAEEIPTVDNGDVAKDGTTTIWKLKKGVKWSDGSDLRLMMLFSPGNIAPTKRLPVSTSPTINRSRRLKPSTPTLSRLRGMIPIQTHGFLSWAIKA